MIWAVKDAMKVLGISISASCMFLPCPHVSTSCSNVHCLLQDHKTVPKSSSIFLDVFAEEGDDNNSKGEGGGKGEKIRLIPIQIPSHKSALPDKHITIKVFNVL